MRVYFKFLIVLGSLNQNPMISTNKGLYTCNQIVEWTHLFSTLPAFPSLVSPFQPEVDTLSFWTAPGQLVSPAGMWWAPGGELCTEATAPETPPPILRLNHPLIQNWLYWNCSFLKINGKVHPVYKERKRK